MSNRLTIDIEVDIRMLDVLELNIFGVFQSAKVGWLVDVGCNPGRLMRSLQSS